MRWVGLTGAVLAAATACTATNPAYEASATDEAGDPEGSSTSAAEVTTGLTSIESGLDSTATSSNESSSEDDGPLPADYCRGDLWAVTQEPPRLYLLDLDAEDAIVMVDDPKIGSWAIATDPSGVVYVSEWADPSRVWRVHPFAFMPIDEEPLMVPADMLETMARAAIHPNGDLWLGTDLNHRFVWFPPDGGTGGEQTSLPLGQGGDMIFLEPECAVVATLEGTLHRVCFGETPPAPEPVPVVNLPAGSQFTGIAIDAMDRLWLSTSDLNNSLVYVHRDGDVWTAMGEVMYDITFNDLATVVEPPGC